MRDPLPRPSLRTWAPKWGPLSHKVGYDVDAQAMGGLIRLPASQTGLRSKRAMRLRTGQGQHVEIAAVGSITHYGVAPQVRPYAHADSYSSAAAGTGQC